MFFFIPASPVYSKIGFSKKGFCQETFEKGLEKNKKLFKKSIQKSISKNQGQKSSQKAKPSPTKNRFKFQNNNPKTGRRALARRVVVLKFVSICCGTWLGFLAKPFSAGLWPPDFWPRFLDRLFEDFSKHFPKKSEK